jgi:hypothetical protein
VLHDLDMTPVIYRIDESLPDRAESIACRYLNSGLPVILLNETDKLGHAKVLVGYGRDEQGLFFVHHDDQQGPYRRTRDLLTGVEAGARPSRALVRAPRPARRGRLARWWASRNGAQAPTPREGIDRLVIPMPGRIYLSGEAAERWTELIFEELLEQLLDEQIEIVRPLLGGLRKGGPLRLRCYATEASAYMIALRQRQAVQDVVDWHTGISVSHWLWIVELQDRAAAARSPDCVLGEVAIDATSDEQWVNPLFGNLPGATFFWPSLGEEIEVGSSAQDLAPYATGCVLHVGS